MRLAGHLGRLPDELGEACSARDLAEWEAFWQLEGPPLGGRLDVLFARLAQRLGAWSRPPRLDDLLEDWSGEGRRRLPTPEELADKLDTWAAACGWHEGRD